MRFIKGTRLFLLLICAVAALSIFPARAMAEDYLDILPSGKQIAGEIDKEYVNQLKEYTLEGISISLPKEKFTVIGERDASMGVVNRETDNLIMFAVNALNLAIQNGRLGGEGSIYSRVKKGFYLTPASVTPEANDYLDYKDAILRYFSPDMNGKVTKIVEYENGDVQGFRIFGKLGRNHQQVFTLFTENDNHIAVTFSSTDQPLTDTQIDTILSTIK